MDIEFQQIEIKYFIRELGVIIFEKGIEKPVFIDCVNFPIDNSTGIRLIGCNYSSVSKKTEEQMMKIENDFIISPVLEDVKKKYDIIKYIPNGSVRDILKHSLAMNDQTILDDNKNAIEKYSKKALFMYHYKRLPTKYKKLFKQQNELYMNDVDVKKRMVDPVKYLKKLNDYFKDGILIHKEGTDLEALKNDSILYKVELKIKNHFDIAVFNPIIARTISPTLYNSYIKVYSENIADTPWLLKYHNMLLKLVTKKLTYFKSHNPLVDAFMTIFVYIIYKKNK